MKSEYPEEACSQPMNPPKVSQRPTARAIASPLPSSRRRRRRVSTRSRALSRRRRRPPRPPPRPSLPCRQGGGAPDHKRTAVPRHRLPRLSYSSSSRLVGCRAQGDSFVLYGRHNGDTIQQSVARESRRQAQGVADGCNTGALQRRISVKSMMLKGCVVFLGTAFPGLRRRA